MLASRVNDLKDLRERAAEMRVSSKELKDNNTAAVIMRLADLYDRLADRAEARSDRAVRSDRAQPKKTACQPGLRCVTSNYDRLRNALRPAAVTTTSAPRVLTLASFVTSPRSGPRKAARRWSRRLGPIFNSIQPDGDAAWRIEASCSAVGGVAHLAHIRLAVSGSILQLVKRTTRSALLSLPRVPAGLRIVR